jgi:MFS family permease
MFEMALQVLPSVIAPNLMQDLQLSVVMLGVMSGMYFYTYAAMQVPSGLLFDRFCAKNIITSALLVCAAGALLFGLAQDFYTGTLARLLMGIGSAFAFVSVLVVASDLFKQQHFALIAGITQALAALGAMLGQFPASFAILHLGWRQTLFLCAFIGIVLAIVVWRVLNYQINQHPFTHTECKTHIRDDLLGIVRSRQNWMIALYACLLWAPMSGFASLWGVPFLMHFDNLTLHQAAFVISMMWLGLAVGSPLLGLLANTLNNRLIPLRLSAATGVIAFLVVLIHPWSEFILIIALFIAGAACSGQALSFAVIRKNNSERVKSTVIAFNNMAVVISGACFQPLMGAVIGFWGRHRFTEPYQAGSMLILCAYLIGTLLAFWIIEERKG